jgi:hypothetical protein
MRPLEPNQHHDELEEVATHLFDKVPTPEDHHRELPLPPSVGEDRTPSPPSPKNLAGEFTVLCHPRRKKNHQNPSPIARGSCNSSELKPASSEAPPLSSVAPPSPSPSIKQPTTLITTKLTLS